MKKIIKIASLVLSVVLILSIFAGCGKGVSNTEQNSKQNYTDSVTSDADNSEKAVGVVKEFVESVIKEDYKSAYSCFGEESEYPFFTPDAIATSIKGTGLGKLLELESGDTIEYECGGYDVTVVCEAKNIRIRILTADVNGKCVIPVKNFVHSEYNVTLPGGETKCYLNGVEITEKYFKEYYENDLKLRKTYTLPNVPIGIVTFKFVSSAFGEKTVKVDTSVELYGATVQVDVNLDAYAAVEKIYNETAQLVSNNAAGDISDDEVAEILPYISKNISSEARDAIARKIISDWGNEFQFDADNSKETNLTGYDFKQCLDSQYRSFYLTDKVISLTFNYSASYDTYWEVDGHTTPRTFNYATTILLEHTNDGYVIYNLMDTDLFTLNYMRNETL